MNPTNFPGRKKFRQEQAVTMQEAANKLTPEAKLANLDKKLGVGVGAKKERAKLQSKILARKQVTVESTPEAQNTSEESQTKPEKKSRKKKS